MKKYTSLIPALTFVVIFIFFSGCKKDPQENFIKITLDHNVAGNKLELNEKWYSCAAGHKFNVIRLKYYLSNFALHKTDGSVFKTDMVHYCDIEKSGTKTINLPEVPNGEYNKLSLIFGLDEVRNVNGGLPNTTTNINMEWPIPGDQGYHYMKFEGKYDVLGSGKIKSYNLHTGATGNNQNYIKITLPLNQPFKMTGEGWSINLLLDLNEWLQNPTVYDFETFGSQIMDNQQAQLILKNNGATVFSVRSVDRN